MKTAYRLLVVCVAAVSACGATDVQAVGDLNAPAIDAQALPDLGAGDLSLSLPDLDAAPAFSSCADGGAPAFTNCGAMGGACPNPKEHCAYYTGLACLDYRAEAYLGEPRAAAGDDQGFLIVSSGVYRQSLDGHVQVISQSLGWMDGFAVNSTDAFLSIAGGISKVPRSGGALQKIVDPPQRSLSGLAADDQVLFLALKPGANTASEIEVVSVAGGTPTFLLAGGATPFQSLVAARGGIYYANGGHIGFVRSGGGSPLSLADVKHPTDLMADEQYLYFNDWADGLFRVPLDGGAPERLDDHGVPLLAAGGYLFYHYEIGYTNNAINGIRMRPIAASGMLPGTLLIGDEESPQFTVLIGCRFYLLQAMKGGARIVAVD